MNDNVRQISYPEKVVMAHSLSYRGILYEGNEFVIADVAYAYALSKICFIDGWSYYL